MSEINIITIFGKTYPIENYQFYIANNEIFVEIVSTGGHVYFRMDHIDIGANIKQLSDLDKHRMHICAYDVEDDDSLDTGTGALPTSGVEWAEKNITDYKEGEA